MSTEPIESMQVSVLLAVYNGARTIGPAIRSILDQTYHKFELIIIDDGSTDETIDVIKSFNDSRICVLRNPINIGFPASLNIGWRAARHDLIAINDADDVSLPNRLESQVEYLSAHPEVDVLGAGVIMMGSRGNELGVALRPAEHEELIKRAYKENFFFHPTVMMRKKFLESLGGYDARFRRAQDCDLFLRGYRRYRYNNLQQPLVRYRVANRPSWNSIYWAAYVIAVNAWRERCLFSKGLYAIRWFAGLSFARLIR